MRLHIDLSTVCNFTWDFGSHFLLEPLGQDRLSYNHRQFFIFSDPEYGGDNTIRPFKRNPKNFCRPYGRDKGQHTVGKKCGAEVRIINS